jgi:hypothetical protein
MAAISQKIPNFLLGVSQQADTLKLDGQLRICDNYYPDTAFGLTKRPGLQGIRKLDNVIDDGTWFNIFRDDQEKYVGQFSKAGVLKIWNANNGVAQIVNSVAAEATAYATHINTDDLQIFQINDYTFVLNRNIVVEEGTTSSAAITPYAFVAINTIAYSSKYFINIDTITAGFTAPQTVTPPQPYLNVEDIVSSLVTKINSAVGISGTYSRTSPSTTLTVTSASHGLVTGDEVHLKFTTGSAFSDLYTVNVTSTATFDVTTVDSSTVSGNVTISKYNGTGTPLYVAQGIGNVIHIRRANNADFAIEAKGGNTGTSIEAFKGKVTAIGQLPRQFINNLKLKVDGSAETGADDYWVIFKTSDNTSTGAGSWEETIGPSVITDFDEETMPHAIIREANGTFTYRQLDQASVPAPGPTSVSGIPTAVSVTSATSGGHVVSEQFDVTGGTGLNLILNVEKIKTVSNSTTFAAASTSYIYQVTPSTWHWFSNNIQIGITASNTNLVIGSKLYVVDGAFSIISNQLRAGYIVTESTTGVVDTISIAKAGQGYTASNVVTSLSGDTFTITTVGTASLNGDELASNFWKFREVGDNDTNPMPTFVGYPIDCISFYKNRLVFTARQNVICSQAGSYFNFFASTVITIVDSDPIDISAGSLKPIQLKHAVSAPTGLLLFGDNAQYILETRTEAFSPKTAEVNLLGAFNQTDRISPVDIGETYLFLEEGTKASSIYELNVKDNIGGKPAALELTRAIPTYIPAAIQDMKVSQSAGTLAILSEQEPSSFYLWRWFGFGETRVSSWFRWILPGTITFFAFEHDILFVVTKQGNNYVLSKISLLTDTPAPSLLFEGNYLDVRLDLFDYNPTIIYDAPTDLTRISFKEGFENTSEQPVLIYLDPENAGFFEEQVLQFDNTKPAGQKYFLTVSGNQSTSKFALGYKYEALAQLPAFYYTKDGARGIKDTLNVPRVHRIKVNSVNSGPYKAIVRAQGRSIFSLELPQIVANNYPANQIPIIRNAQSTIPIMAKGDQFEFELIADSPFQTAFTSIDWEGTYDNKGIKAA